MKKRFLTVLLALLLALSLTACSPAEVVGGWLDKLTENMDGLIPNDVELMIAQLTGQAIEEEEHEILFSEGCVNVLKSGVFHITYHLEDGTEVELGSNGIRVGSSYPEPSEGSGEVTYDEEGNEIPPVVPTEHLVLKDSVYYYVDDAQSKLFTVNPANYKAVPFSIATGNIALAATGTESFDGKSCRFERYSTDSGNLTFYYENGTLSGLVVEQSGTHTLYNVTAFDKYLNPALVSMPSGYTVVQYWTGEE